MFLIYNNPPRINALSVKRAGEFKTDKIGATPISIAFAINTSELSKKNTCAVTLKVDVAGEKSPLTLSIELESEFGVEGSPNEDDLQKAGAMEAGPILFTLAREYIAEITRKMNFPPLVLPIPDFMEASRENKDTKASEEK